MATLLKWIILLPVLLGVLLFAIANDQSVTVRLNPFDIADPVLRADLALYQFGFIMFVAGALIGAVITWSGQHKHRKRARQRRNDTPVRPGHADRVEHLREAEMARATAAAFLPRPGRT